VINDKNSPAIVSDLTDEEFTKFKDASAPNTNDILDMHAYLKDFDGDFSGLFRNKV